MTFETRTLARMLLILALLLMPDLAAAGERAARKTDLTSHAGSFLGGAATVLIEGQPAANKSAFASCPIPGHNGGTILIGSTTVRIEGTAAARVNDLIGETGATSQVVTGATNVFIGP